MKKILYFEAVGMDFYGEKEGYNSDVNNHRIRTSFKNDEGKQFFIDIGNAYVYDKKGKKTGEMRLSVDFMCDVNDKDETGHINHNRYKVDLQVVKTHNYTKSDIVRFINTHLNCSFESMEVLDRFYGYRTHKGNDEYNLMEDIEVNHARANARRKVYNETVEKYVSLFNRKYPAINIEEMTDEYMILDNYQGEKLLNKYGLESRYEKVYVNY